jgi:1,4-dihydroxy-6-naphthoate synthase
MLKFLAMISLGFSPCPNDTFIFYALSNKKIDNCGLDFNLVIEDVETLNQLAMKRTVDVTKISCHAYCYLQDDYQFLRAGGAFGRGCGPLIVSKETYEGRDLKDKKIAIPGKLTTASLLLKLYFYSSFGTLPIEPVVMPFHKIMEFVKDGMADAGLIIHESRFTYHEYGLRKVIDLGDWWEKETGLPIPLGGIIAKKSLGISAIKTIEEMIRTSVKYSMSNREEALPFIRQYSQELSEKVIMEHISLYVNDYTLDIGEDGLASLDELLKRANSINSRKNTEV